MKKQIFRQSALDRLSSPEQLDMLFQVVRPAYWAALSALLLLLSVLVVWGFYGTVTTMVSGQGILLREGRPRGRLVSRKRPPGGHFR